VVAEVKQWLRKPWIAWLWRFGVIGVLIGVALLALRPFLVAAPDQPLPFSHGHHADDMGIDCLFCHDGADRSPVAGVPPVDKCLLCHDKLLRDFPPILKLHTYAQNNEAIPWVRVYRLSDFAFFDHQAHVNEGIDCSHCHGNVKGMERIVLNQPLEMGFCVNCHRKHNESVDCWLCHR